MLEQVSPDTTIETERLILRPVLLEEAKQLLAGETPTTVHFSDGYKSEFLHEVMDIFVGSRANDAIGFTPWFIIRKAEGDYIGEIGYSTPHGPQRPTTGYSVSQPLWGKGYASEALQGLLGYLLQQPGVEAVEADTFDHHIASRRVMEKAGMHHFDTRQQEEDGEMATLVFYEIRKPSWRRLSH